MVTLHHCVDEVLKLDEEIFLRVLTSVGGG